MSLAATLIGVGLGLIVGLSAAYLGGVWDEILMRIADVFMAFPQIVLALLLVTAFGPKVYLIILTVGISHAPRVARVIRGAAQQVVERDFIKAAEAVGEPRRRVIFGELLPNVTSPLLVEFGLRLTYSIGLIAGINFLGLGLQPPQSDWGLMINENRLSLTVQPWGVLLPIIAIAVLTIGTNLLTDAYRPRRDRHRPRRDDDDDEWPSQTHPPTTRSSSATCGSSSSPPARTSSIRSCSRSPPARCSGSSASPARARPPSAWRCWATAAPAARSSAARS